MNVLGIETSCDETAASVCCNGRTILSSIVASQDELHRKYGGVIPEIASRAHVRAILPIVQEALDVAHMDLEQIDGIAVVNRPGLVGSLLTGLMFAKSVSYTRKIPLAGVNHLEAHIYASLLENEIEFPAVSLIVSGGHTVIYYSEDELNHSLIGSTIDDAAGEAFDKVASILNVGYPGGPAIDRMASRGSRDRFDFPRSFINSDDLKFSFSGLKTAVLYTCQGHSSGKTEIRDMSEQEKNDIAASFQEAVVDVIIDKLKKAVHTKNVKTVLTGGGVMCNSRLRERLKKDIPAEVYIPSPAFCIDNGAMVAGLGYHLFDKQMTSSLLLDVDPSPVRMN